MIASGCTLDELLTMGEHMFHNPVILVDASQYVIATSSSALHSSDSPDWKRLMEQKSLPEERLKLFNQAHSDTFTRTGVFVLPADYFPTSSYCKHVFINSERFATIILPELEKLPAKSSSHLLEIFAPFLEQWVQNNLAEDSSYHLTSYFARSLDGSPDSVGELARRLSLFGWEPSAPKQILVAAVISEQFHFDAHLSRILTAEIHGVYAIPYQKRLVVLCNLELMDYGQFIRAFKEIMRKNNYYGAVSFPFTDLGKIAEAYRQSLTAQKDGVPESGRLYECRRSAMKYITGVVQSHTDSSLLHPVLEQIISYDRSHKTKYYETLFCFLRNERSHQLASKELFIHRNTLFLRLEKIQSLWQLDLDDPDERFYLLYSFFQQEYQS